MLGRDPSGSSPLVARSVFRLEYTAIPTPYGASLCCSRSEVGRRNSTKADCHGERHWGKSASVNVSLSHPFGIRVVRKYSAALSITTDCIPLSGTPARRSRSIILLIAFTPCYNLLFALVPASAASRLTTLSQGRPQRGQQRWGRLRRVYVTLCRGVVSQDCLGFEKLLKAPGTKLA